MTMRPTMQDVARACGLSMMTVSRVLRGHPNVSPKTKERVVTAAVRLGYSLNILASNFSRMRSGLVGIATPFQGLIGSYYFGEILRGFQSVFEETEWNFALFDIFSSSFNNGEKLAALCRTRQVDGLLVVAPNANDRFLDTFSDLKFPIVVVGKKVANPRIPSVACEDARGITLVCEHLRALGHRRIAFVGGPSGFSVARERERAFRTFLRRHRLPAPAEYFFRGDYSMRSGREAGLALLALSRSPTAIIAANDMMALGVLESARERNRPVPTTLSVAGFDDFPQAAESFPGLTSVRQPVFEMASLGAGLLHRWLEGRRSPPGQAVLPVSLSERASTASPGQ